MTRTVAAAVAVCEEALSSSARAWRDGLRQRLESEGVPAAAIDRVLAVFHIRHEQSLTANRAHLTLLVAGVLVNANADTRDRGGVPDRWRRLAAAADNTLVALGRLMGERDRLPADGQQELDVLARDVLDVVAEVRARTEGPAIGEAARILRKGPQI